MTEDNERKVKIRALNDQFRTTLQGGKFVVTAGVQALGPHRLLDMLRVVRDYAAFTEDNDPYGEHDFGAFEIAHGSGCTASKKCFWKIDYYSKDMSAGSDDPSDPDQTTRVLTVMLADEY